MIPAQRQKIILDSLTQNKVLSITELTEFLGVSHMTIRRDIQKLEQEGRVLSVSGGIQLAEHITSEPSHVTKRSLYFDEKRAIAREAAKLVKPHMTVYLDAGTTSLVLAEYISGFSDLVVISNDLVVIEYLIQHSQCQLYHTGGFVLRKNHSCVGNHAGDFLLTVNVDIGFLSASSWTMRGISTPDEMKVSVKKSAALSAAKRVFICDSSKYGKIATFNALSLDKLDVIITDDKLPENVQATIRQNGIQLIIAEKE